MSDDKTNARETIETKVASSSAVGSVEKRAVAVFDILGPAYYYNARNSKGWKENATAAAMEAVEDALGYMPDETTAITLELELILQGQTKPEMTLGFVETVLELKKCGIVSAVVSAGTQDLIAYIVKRAATEYSLLNRLNLKSEDIIKLENQVSTSTIGSKKEQRTWLSALAKTSVANLPVAGIFEDTLINLQTAMKAYGCNGYPVIYSAGLGNTLAVMQNSPTVYMGNMVDIHSHVKRVF